MDFDDLEKEGGNTLRVRVRIDVHKPLRRGTIIKIGSKGEEEWITMKCEKLPDYCYGCGRMGHLAKECEDPETLNNDKLQYGTGLKMDFPYRNKIKGKVEMETAGQNKGDRWRKKEDGKNREADKIQRRRGPEG